MSRVIIFGNKSFIQKHLYSYLKKKKFNVIKKKFEDLKKTFFYNNDIVINCSTDSELFLNKYEKKKDRNYHIANYIKNKNIKFFLLSTRMVYKPKKDIHEKSQRLPINCYGLNCLESEFFCKKILKNKLLILRISNVIGYEIRKKRTSLMSELIKGAKKQKITLDNSYNFKKDIIPIKFFCNYIYIIIKLKYTGLLNIGSGVSFTLLNLAKKLTAKKNITIIDSGQQNLDNSYTYNIAKLVKLTKIKYTKFEVLNEISKIKNRI